MSRIFRWTLKLLVDRHPIGAFSVSGDFAQTIDRGATLFQRDSSRRSGALLVQTLPGKS
jgi:hypothetical protein